MSPVSSSCQVRVRVRPGVVKPFDVAVTVRVPGEPQPPSFFERVIEQTVPEQLVAAPAESDEAAVTVTIGAGQIELLVLLRVTVIVRSSFSCPLVLMSTGFGEAVRFERVHVGALLTTREMPTGGAGGVPGALAVIVYVAAGQFPWLAGSVYVKLFPPADDIVFTFAAPYPACVGNVRVGVAQAVVSLTVTEKTTAEESGVPPVWVTVFGVALAAVMVQTAGSLTTKVTLAVATPPPADTPVVLVPEVQDEGLLGGSVTGLLPSITNV
jgi:hypothetical protein